jgi:hypothetical protein
MLVTYGTMCGWNSPPKAGECKDNAFQERGDANFNNLPPPKHFTLSLRLMWHRTCSSTISDTRQMHLRGTVGERVECLMQCIIVRAMHSTKCLLHLCVAVEVSLIDKIHTSYNTYTLKWITKETESDYCSGSFIQVFQFSLIIDWSSHCLIKELTTKEPDHQRIWKVKSYMNTQLWDLVKSYKH